VRADPPTTADFLSDQAKGRPPRPEQIADPRLYEGVSVWDDPAPIRVVPWKGFIAELEVPEGSPIQVHDTRGERHWTLIGTPSALLACVRRTIPL
jgi:hypothetical protein